jgi:glyoxylase-like metal-dependent hydrolase (beta-lactamase superfamily II)
MQTLIKHFNELIQDGAKLPAGWGLKAVVNDDNLTFVAWNEQAREAIVVDPMREDWEALVKVTQELESYRFLGVIDTHTHADHVSCAARLAEQLKTPLIMHQVSPSKKIHLRVSRDVALPSAAAPLKILLTPGHTQDSLTPIWGPFIFGGDTLLYGDVGRDDLPGGDPEAHYWSTQKIKQESTPDMIFLPGHDHKGARASSWKTQLEINPFLTHEHDVFVREAGEWVGPSPKLLKESLFENFK